MAGISTSLTTVGLDRAVLALNRLTALELAQLSSDAAALLESSTRKRFETKMDPQGDPWDAWSQTYDDTRNHGTHSLLVSEGDLLDSIAGHGSADQAEVGSNLVYAAHHQIGGEEIDSGVPARPYLGVSRDDVSDLRDLVTGYFEELVQ